MNRHARRGAILAAGVLALGPSLAFAEVGRYIVSFQPGRAAEGTAALKAANGRVVLSLPHQNAAAVMLPPQAVEALGHNPNVEYVEVDPIREPLALWSDTTSGGETLPYGIQMIQANRITAGDPGSRTICIIDSGYGLGHEDLAGERLVSGEAVDPGSGHWYMDSCGHGTHVAGTLSAIAGNHRGVVGVTPGVRLHIVKVFGDDDLAGGSCGWTYSSTLIEALKRCADAGANVVSMSLGGGGRSRTEERAFAAAYANGVLSIAAAGNDGNRTTSYPAGYGSVVSVAAVDANETIASFSQVNADVEIAAPGVSVLSTLPWVETDVLATRSSAWTGAHVEGAAWTGTKGVTGTLVDGGQCTAAGAWTGKTVLCQRGTISFADKVANVMGGGGTAAVIYNNVTSDSSCGLFLGTLGSGVTSTLPAITLSCADGAAALEQAGSAGTVVSSFEAPASGYAAWDGTSMATPHVSGAAALIWSCNPAWTAAQIRQALDLTAKDVGRGGRDPYYGFGIVQAKAALEYLGSVTGAGSGTCTLQ